MEKNEEDLLWRGIKLLYEISQTGKVMNVRSLGIEVP